MPFLTALLALAVARGSDGPTSTGNPQSTDEIKTAGQELIDVWFEANQKRDASAIQALLTKDIAGLCTVEQMEQYLAFDVNPSPSPEVDVKQVFMGPDNAEEAIMVMEMRIEPRPGHENTDANVESLAYPIFMKDAIHGRRRMAHGFSLSLCSPGRRLPVCRRI